MRWLRRSRGADLRQAYLECLHADSDRTAHRSNLIPTPATTLPLGRSARGTPPRSMRSVLLTHLRYEHPLGQIITQLNAMLCRFTMSFPAKTEVFECLLSLESVSTPVLLDAKQPAVEIRSDRRSAVANLLQRCVGQIELCVPA